MPELIHNDDYERIPSRDAPTSEQLSFMRSQIRALFRMFDEKHTENCKRDDLRDSKLDLIYDQTCKTNGRVNQQETRTGNCEARIDALETVRDIARGAVWAIGICGCVVGAVVGYIIAIVHK